MENDSKLTRFLQKILDQLNDQVWFQQIRSKWEELDTQSQLYLKLAVGALCGLVILGVVFSAWSNVRDLRKRLNEKTELVAQLERAMSEKRRLQAQTSGGVAQGGANAGAPWPEYFQSTANTAGIDTSSVTVSAEKPGAEGEISSESLFEIDLKKINIRQLARYGYQLERGGRPVKLRNLEIDAEDELTGYLDAKLYVSAFTPKEQE